MPSSFYISLSLILSCSLTPSSNRSLSYSFFLSSLFFFLRISYARSKFYNFNQILTGLSPFLGESKAETFSNITAAVYSLQEQEFQPVRSLYCFKVFQGPSQQSLGILDRNPLIKSILDLSTKFVDNTNKKSLLTVKYI